MMASMKSAGPDRDKFLGLTAQNSEDQFRQRLTVLQGAKARHIGTSPHPERYSPDLWDDEFAHLSRPVYTVQNPSQAILLLSERMLKAYPVWQNYLRNYKPPTLVIWGKYDPSFALPEAEAYKREVPDAGVYVLEAGHFALDEAVDEIATLMRTFLEKVPQ